MREIHVERICECVQSLYSQACCVLGEDVRALLRRAREEEASPFGAETLSQIIENYEVADRDRVPICQDTGMAVVFVTLGQDVHITGGALADAVDEGVRRAVAASGLRASVLDPLTRKNTGDNTPAILHLSLAPGDGLHIEIAPKGFGSENMSRLFMLQPSAGREGVIEAIVTAVREAGGNPCPPIIVGAGIGGTMERAAYLAKHSLLRPAGSPSDDAELAAMESECLSRINRLGIGPMGLGGKVSALAVHIESFPTHIAALPVAVNIQCHCARHAAGDL